MDRLYFTTPLYYVNAQPHLGHTYTTIIADTLKRYHRMRGRDVYLLTGTDEHGDKIAQAAAADNTEPKAYADRISALFRSTWDTCGIAYDHFIRTTDDYHKATVSRILQHIYDAGDIYFGEYGGYYCYGCERFYTEKELQDGKCPDHQTAATYIEEKNYFFRMSKYQDRLIEHINEDPGFITPQRYRTEVLSFLREPLEDLCISRPKSRLEWGIPLPFDGDYVTYVWFDALINYVSAVELKGADFFNTYWPCANHIIAKDILKPHGIFWPTMLMAAGLPLYQRLNVHGYWIMDKRQDVQEPGQRHPPARHEGTLRHGRLPLLPAAGNGVRPGLVLLAGSVREPGQRRLGQQLRQPGEPRPCHAKTVFRRGRSTHGRRRPSRRPGD